MKYTINAYSTALFSTWINIEELNLLVDAGDGISAGLLSKSRKIKHVFITHPDRDHLNGLPQFVQLNARNEFPHIYYPKDSGSFPAMRDFLKHFDPHVDASVWEGIVDGQCIPIKKGYEILAIRNEHIDVPIGIHKSLSYQLFETKQKLKSSFQHLSGAEIKEIVLKQGAESISETIRNKIICFSGDTPVDDYSKWDRSQILIHESTFLDQENGKQVIAKGNRHSTLKQVMEMVKEIDVQVLILNHFSSRYSKEMITAAVRKEIKRLNLQLPIHVIFPGEIARDILRGPPINE